MQIRELNEAHLPALLELYVYLHEQDSPIPSLDIAEEIWRSIQRNDDLVYFGLFISKRLISSCTVTLVPNLTRGCRPYAVIENVVTHEEYRGNGYGKAVLEAALEHAWKSGCYKAMLMTGRLDEGTFRFYESAGFSRHEKQAFVARPGKI